jgi:ribosome assembly protein 4
MEFNAFRDPMTGNLSGTLRGHSRWITSVAWEPFHVYVHATLAMTLHFTIHRNPDCRRFVTGSKDGTARVWDARTKRCEFVLSQHTDAVTCVKWGGEGFIYTASRDKSIKIWNASNVGYDL